MECDQSCRGGRETGGDEKEVDRERLLRRGKTNERGGGEGA